MNPHALLKRVIVAMPCGMRNNMPLTDLPGSYS